MEIKRLVEEYLEAKRRQGLGALTVDQTYALPLRGILAPWVEQRGLTEAGELLDEKAMDELKAVIRARTVKAGRDKPDRPISDASVKSYVGVINGFLRWLAKETGTDKVIMPNGKLKRVIRDTLTRDEIARLQKAARNDRDELIVRLLANTGMRVGGLLGLKLTDIKSDAAGHAYVKITQKGGDELELPLDPGTQRQLERYISRRRPKDTQRPEVFLSLQRRDGEYGKLTRSGVEQLLRSLATMAGIQKRVYPHLLRHSLATEMLERNINPLAVATQLGHANLSMIYQHYGHLTKAHLRANLMELLKDEKPA
jgi:site-specific recombinase XerD